MNIMKHKKWFLLISLVVMLPGIISLLFNGLNLAVDFTGGSLISYTFENSVEDKASQMTQAFTDKNIEVIEVAYKSPSEVSVETQIIDPSIADEVRQDLEKTFSGVKQNSFETVGPTIGKETTMNAFKALFIVSVGIVLYIAYAFKNIPKPFSSYRFGVSAIVAMLHDAVLVLGIFSILGVVSGTKVDALFITALLTVIGFSVHDTIVVFDRVRENLSKLPKSTSFEGVVNHSVVETLNRSFATSLTVVITLAALLLLGGDTTRDFVLALLIGIISGTYSSIFTAAPILVYWEEYVSKKPAKKKK